MVTLYESYVLVIDALVVIITTTAMMPYHFVKSLALIWRLGTRKIHRLIPDLQVTGSYLTRVRGYLDNIASNGRQVTHLILPVYYLIPSMLRALHDKRLRNHISDFCVANIFTGVVVCRTDYTERTFLGLNRLRPILMDDILQTKNFKFIV